MGWTPSGLLGFLIFLFFAFYFPPVFTLVIPFSKGTLEQAWLAYFPPESLTSFCADSDRVLLEGLLVLC